MCVPSDLPQRKNHRSLRLHEKEAHMRCTHLIGSIAALAVALFFATTALATSAPKNQLPLTPRVAQTTFAPDWFERYAAAHPYGRNLNTQTLPFAELAADSNRGPDVFERYA